MKWKGWKWCFAFVAISFLVCLGLIAYADLRGGPNPDRHAIFGFAVIMMATFYPFIIAVIVLLPYALLTKRWYALGGACLGSLFWYPAIPILGVMVFIVAVRKLLKVTQGRNGSQQSSSCDVAKAPPHEN